MIGTRRSLAVGMSLPEMLVSLALAGVVLLAGTTLLLQLTRQASVEIGREHVVGSQIDVAVRLIVRDLRQARRLPPVSGEAEGEVLHMLLPDGQQVVYRREGTDLLRARATGDDPEFHERVILTEVATVDFSRRARHGVWDIWLRQEEGEVKHAVVLTRNLGRDVVGDLR